MSIFQSAIRGPDGEVDSSYLASYVVTALWAFVVVTMVSAAIGAMCLTQQHTFDAAGLGAGIRDVSLGLAAVIGGGGIFRWGDKK